VTLNLAETSVAVRPSVTRPQEVFLISMKFGVYVEVDDWCTTICSMTWSKVMVHITSPWELDIHFQKLSSPFTTGAGNWPLIR